MKNLVIVSVLIFGLFFISCKKYEDGPYVSLRSFKKKIVGTWEATQQFEDDKEYLNKWTLTFDQLEDSKNPEGSINTYTMFLADGSNDEVKYKGIWEVSSDKKQIIMNFSSISYNVGNGWQTSNDHSKLTFDINRITKDELWVDSDVAPHKYSFRFKKI